MWLDQHQYRNGQRLHSAYLEMMVFFVILGDFMEAVSPGLIVGLISILDILTDPLDNCLKCRNNVFVFRKPILCFKSSYEIVLDVGSDVFTVAVGVNIGVVDTFLDVFLVRIF